MKLYLVNGTSIVSEPFNTDYLLQTFFNVNKRDIENIKKFIDRRGADNFILDSGAFSLFNGGGKMDYTNLKKYIDKYCDFINRYDIKQFIEMDIDSIIGYEEVKKINKYIESRTGKKPLYVHHQFTREFEELEKACKENEYIFYGGIAGIMRVDEDVINSFVDYAYGFGTKVHILGYTPLSLENCKNLYSCDSSSWTMGGRNGNIYQFTNNKLETIKLDNKRRVSFYELNNHNMNQWIKYQGFLKTKGWITT
jgi:hypothetical protein